MSVQLENRVRYKAIPPETVPAHTHVESDITSLESDLTILAADVYGAEQSANKDAIDGYAGLNADSRITKGIDTTDDIIIDTTATGLVLKDADGHYWRIGISTLGIMTTSDLGTSKP